MLYLRGRSILLSVLTLVALVTLTSARLYSSYDLPSPQKDPSACGRGNGKSAVCDPDGYLSKSEADEIDGLINFINEGSHGFKKLPCDGSTGGPQIAIGIVGSMARGSGRKEERAFQFAKDLHDRWGVGEASCQNGIVIFVAIKDRAMGFSTGKGIKKVFTDAMVPKVMALMRPKMREEEYGQALITAVTAIGNILSTGKAPVVASSDDSSVGSGIFFILFSTIFGLSSCFNLRKRRRYNRSKKLLEKIDKDRARASNNNYVITSCPICLEDFPGTTSNTTASTTTSGDQANTSVDAKDEPLTSTVRVVQTGSHPSTATTSAQDNDPVKTLPCGHKFHQSCITSWISGPSNTNQLCPICRQPIVESVSQIEERTNGGRPSGWDVYDPEYSFRMQRANYFYPDYITWSMINSWERDRYSRHHSMANSSTFVAVDPVVIAAQARASGSGGSSFSFGGGSSGGGGGGGGGW